jgi:hypothetical protein
MAEKTFTEKQREIVARKMGYEGPMSMFDKYRQSTPADAQKYGLITEKFMARGGMVSKMAEGGLVSDLSLNEQARQWAKNELAAAERERTLLQANIDLLQREKDRAAASTAGVSQAAGTTTVDPITGLPVQPTAAQIPAALNVPNASQDVTTQLAPTQASTVTAAAPVTAATTAAPTVTPAATVTAATAAPSVSAALEDVEAAKGTVSKQAQVTAAQMEPTTTAVGDLQAAQGTTARVEETADRTLQAGELVSGPAVNMAQVEQSLAKNEAAQGVVTEEMTVQGQLGKLMADFETGNPPPWAAASLRNATATLAARGLGASSLAGQAIIQATLEAATPIAAQDAAVFQQMGMQNLSNRQQTAILTAQQRAQFLGQEFDQAFQTKVLNASKISDIANMNFTADQQVALENARLAQTMNLANLSNRQALVMAEAAQIANLETANLNNRQQAAVINAQSFLQMDMANLANEQQTEIFKAQSNVQSILTDTAAVNAARQFNATSQNQTDQFFANLTTQVGQFNTTQTNAMSQFNVDQANTVAKFNSEVQNQRDQFNATNRLVIDQSNAQWRREISTANTAAINRANEFNATKAMEITMVEYNNMWQQFRDEIEYSWKSSESAKERVNAIAKQEIASNATILAATMTKDANLTLAIGDAVGKIIGGTTLPADALKLLSSVGGKIWDEGSEWIGSFFGGSSSGYVAAPPGYQYPNVEE